MADGDLYLTDILAWSEQQAGALRELASRRDLPNTLDLTHVAEEIEDVGLSELNGVKSRIRLILGHAVKCLDEPQGQSVPHWLAEIGNWQSDLADRFSASMRQRIGMDVLWQRALRQAALDLAAQGVRQKPLLEQLAQAPCPLSLDDVLADPADPAALVQRLEAAAPKP
jgi:hypothetical protein